MKKIILIVFAFMSIFGYSQNIEILERENLRKERTSNSQFSQKIFENNTDYELYDVVDNKPIYLQTYNVDAAASTRTNYVHQTGYSGDSETLYIWDSGRVLDTHQEFNGRIIFGDNSTEITNHATHVGGTLIANGTNPLAKGMSFNANLVSYDWTSDAVEASMAASQGMLLSNHSYGLAPLFLPDYYFGAYINRSRDWDIIMYDNPYYLQVSAAGNSGNKGYNGTPLDSNFPQYDNLTGFGTSKNGLSVAAAHDAVLSSSGELIEVQIAQFSSMGPTDDLRIKPDITGNGVGLLSSTYESNASYNSFSGTSMASPNVSGSLMLLQEQARVARGSYLRSSSLKGLALHTADGTGLDIPNATYGWGLLNLKRASETISNSTDNNSIIRELVLDNNGEYITYVTSNEVNNLQASISWTDPAGIATTNLNDMTPRLVNDLDLRVEKVSDGTIYYPWVLTGVNTKQLADNNRDPFEKINIENPIGEYKIIVTHKGSLTNNTQPYTLIVTGIEEFNSVCSVTIPNGVSISSPTESSVNIVWNYIEGVTFEIHYKDDLSSNWEVITTSSNSYNINNLSSDTNYSSKVRSLCDGVYSDFSNTLSFTTLSPCVDDVPTNLNVINVTDTGATIQWSSDSGTLYNLRYKKVTDSVYTTIFTTNSSHSISQLEGSETYVGNIRTGCPSNLFSDWSVDFNFTTQQPCIVVPPSNITVSNIQGESVTLNWDLVPNATSYRLTWRLIGGGIFTVSSTNSPPRVLTNLTPNSNYRLEIQSRCASGTLSDYSESFYFTTGTCNIETPSNHQILDLTHNSAEFIWDGDSPEHEISYTPTSGGTTITNVISGNMFQINNLQPDTSYNIEIRGRCGSSVISSPLTFQITTLPVGCDITISLPLTLTEVTQNGASITWYDDPSVISYTIRIKQKNGNHSWQEYTVNTNNYSFINLNSNTVYETQIRKYCSNGYSPYNSSLEFRTLKSGGSGGGPGNNNGGGNNKNITIYPVPTNNSEFFIISTEIISDIIVTDIYGRTIMFDKEVNLDNVKIILKNNNSNVYIVRINNESYIIFNK